MVLVPLWRPLTSIDRAAAAPQEQVELLRSVPIFSPLAAPALERLAKALVETRAESGTVIFDEGARGDDFYVIADGRASVEIGGTSIRTLGPRDFFGEVALLRDVPRTATVRAITPLRLLGLDRETFVATVTGHPPSAQAAGSIVSARLPGPVIT